VSEELSEAVEVCRGDEAKERMEGEKGSSRRTHESIRPVRMLTIASYPPDIETRTWKEEESRQKRLKVRNFKRK
jgi:hypothetical protein